MLQLESVASWKKEATKNSVSFESLITTEASELPEFRAKEGEKGGREKH